MTSGTSRDHCRCTPVVDGRFDAVDRRPTEAIVETLAAAADVEPTALPPLDEFVDLDALERLLVGHGGNADAEMLVSFAVEDWNVFVRGDGRIRVCDATELSEMKPVFDTSIA